MLSLKDAPSSVYTMLTASVKGQAFSLPFAPHVAILQESSYKLIAQTILSV